MTEKYLVPAVLHVTQILKLLSRYKYRKCTLSEISEILSISKSTCMRILKTLEEHNYVSYDSSTKQYSLGSYLVILGSRASEQIDYIPTLKKSLRDLVDETTLTSFIVSQISDNRLMYLLKEEGTGSILINISVGNQFPVTEVSYGMNYLAFMDENERDQILSSGLLKKTPNTITDIYEYRKKLDLVKQDGYVISSEEYILGVNAMSVPIFDSSGNVALCIGSLGPASIMDEEGIKQTALRVKQEAEKLTNLIGPLL